VSTAAPGRTWSVTGEPERHHLDATSWVDVTRGWLADADEVYAAITTGACWRQNTVWQYDHARAENRLTGWTRRGRLAVHPAVAVADRALRARYGVNFGEGASLCWYRDGRDAMGAHRDSDLRWCTETLIAILTLGARRPWTLTPSGARAPAFDVSPASGDLLVMGGHAQLDWLHGVPPVRGLRDGRVSVQWRWTSRRGRPETGPTSGAPRRWGSVR